MARNLQAKLPTSDTMKVYDINPAMVERFANDTKALKSGAAVEAAGNVREAAEDSVRLFPKGYSYPTAVILHTPYVMSLFYP